MEQSEEANIAALINEQDQQDSSQTTVVLEDQVPAPATPFEGLQNHLQDHPYDITAWQDLINIAEDSGDFKLIHMAYDSLLKLYPNTVSSRLQADPTEEPRVSEKNCSFFFFVFVVYSYHPLCNVV